MTLPTSGPISIDMICTEFSLPNNSVFPTAFYGKGGAPASGPLSLEDFYGRSAVLDVSITPTTVSATGTTSTLTTPPATASASNGTGPYTYSWTENPGGDPCTASNPTSATTTFTFTGVEVGSPVAASWTCTVTDAYGATGSHAISANATRTL
jgi:hypothetical protein